MLILRILKLKTVGFKKENQFETFLGNRKFLAVRTVNSGFTITALKHSLL